MMVAGLGLAATTFGEETGGVEIAMLVVGVVGCSDTAATVGAGAGAVGVA